MYPLQQQTILSVISSPTEPKTAQLPLVYSRQFLKAMLPFSALLPLLLLLAVAALVSSVSAACSTNTCTVSEACKRDDDCREGLYCGSCPAAGKKQLTCTRGRAVLPSSVVKGLPFNKYSWLVTHNSFSIEGEPSRTGTPRITFYNQDDSVTDQLMNGVRGLMLDMYDFEGDIWLCHSLRGQCFNFTAFEPAIDTLKEVEKFLRQNPTEIITIIIEDYVHTPKGLTNLFTRAGLMKYWFPISEMPTNGSDWPTITDMVAKNHRFLVFTSDATKQASEGIAFQWKYLLENEPGDPGLVKGTCPNRKESQPLNSKVASLILMDYFPTYPISEDACMDHSRNLSEMVDTCYKASGNVMPNFLAVNYYKRSDGGGVFDVLDRMNGLRLCGCDTVTSCQVSSSPGSCKNTSLGSIDPVNAGHGNSGSTQLASSSVGVYSFLICILLHIKRTV